LDGYTIHRTPYGNSVQKKRHKAERPAAICHTSLKTPGKKTLMQIRFALVQAIYGRVIEFFKTICTHRPAFSRLEFSQSV
jgi:hypothetical protein